MGEIADMVITGRQCQHCGIMLIRAHGYPVLCKSCYNELDFSERNDYQKATIKEI